MCESRENNVFACRMSCAFCYYGLVLMTTELFETASITCSDDPTAVQSVDTCAAECRQLQTTDYMDLLWTTLAEFPGIFATIFIIERFGRKKTMAVQFVAYAICCCFLVVCTKKYHYFQFPWTVIKVLTSQAHRLDVDALPGARNNRGCFSSGLCVHPRGVSDVFARRRSWFVQCHGKVGGDGDAVRGTSIIIIPFENACVNWSFC